MKRMIMELYRHGFISRESLEMLLGKKVEDLTEEDHSIKKLKGK